MAVIKLSNDIESTPKKTCIGGNPKMIKTSTMNKSRKRSYKPYKGQGR